jgi:uncharacterized protein YkwD
MSGPRVLALSCVAACAALVPGPALAAGSTPPMIAKVNKVRAKRGLPRLRYSRSLGRSSGRFARHLMRVDRFGHAARIHASGHFRMLGEVLAIHSGWGARYRAVIRGWLRSPPHRVLLLSRALRYVGAGRARGRFRGRRSTIWVVQFGAR